ncbi:MAG: hypothetical protein PHE06_14595, partial [Lachnospiraceae bacterium]|nr:hypothetical protein [Lachnospiraceae bacterium]
PSSLRDSVFSIALQSEHILGFLQMHLQHTWGSRPEAVRQVKSWTITNKEKSFRFFSFHHRLRMI